MDDLSGVLPTLYTDLERDEGIRTRPYVDSVGKHTIGVGHNLDDVPLSGRAVRLILEDDVATAIVRADQLFPWWRTACGPTWSRVFLNLVFNMGPESLLTFHDFLQALRHGDGNEAADALLDSRYAKQTGMRAQRLAQLLRSTSPQQ